MLRYIRCNRSSYISLKLVIIFKEIKLFSKLTPNLKNDAVDVAVFEPFRSSQSTFQTMFYCNFSSVKQAQIFSDLKSSFTNRVSKNRVCKNVVFFVKTQCFLKTSCFCENAMFFKHLAKISKISKNRVCKKFVFF